MPIRFSLKYILSVEHAFQRLLENRFDGVIVSVLATGAVDRTTRNGAILWYFMHPYQLCLSFLSVVVCIAQKHRIQFHSLTWTESGSKTWSFPLEFFVRAIWAAFSNHEAPIWTFLMAIRVYLIHHIPQPPDAQFELHKFIVSNLSGSNMWYFAFAKHHGDCLDTIGAAFSNHVDFSYGDSCVLNSSYATTTRRPIWRKYTQYRSTPHTRDTYGIVLMGVRVVKVVYFWLQVKHNWPDVTLWYFLILCYCYRYLPMTGVLLVSSL